MIPIPIPLWAITAAGAGIVAGAVGFRFGSLGPTATLERERAAWAQERAAAAVLRAEWEGKARKAEGQAREIEHRWLTVARAIDTDGAKHAETLRVAAGRADAAVVGLRAQLGAVVAEAARSAEAGASAADARQRAAAAEAARVLAELLAGARAGDRARSGYADAAAAAGERCERWADEVASQRAPP